jgi:hypothetical protein
MSLQKPIVLEMEISAARGKCYFAITTVMMLTKALLRAVMCNPEWAACDGTGRLNYQGKILTFVCTADAANVGHLIGMFMLSLGEDGQEVARGLKAIQVGISAVHSAMLSLPSDAPQRLYDAERLGADYKWLPNATMNDSSNALSMRGSYSGVCLEYINYKS